MRRKLAGCCALLAAAALAPAAVAQADPKIVGGHRVFMKGHPWQVALYEGGATPDDQICGGSIRDATHVITAAHCVVDDRGNYPVPITAGHFLVGYGKRKLDDQLMAQVQRVTVDRRYFQSVNPESFRNGGTDDRYDWAILTLKAPLTFGEPAPKPIPLATTAQTAEYVGPAFVTGWGDLYEDGPEPADHILRGVGIPIVPDGECGSRYGSTYDGNLMVCAGGSGKDTCQGDSGGPLTIDVDPSDAGVDRRLVGVTSGGNGCARPGVPGYYTWLASPAIFDGVSAPDPPARPHVAGNPTVSGTLQVGRQVTCNPPPLPAGVSAAQYVWYVFRQGPGWEQVAWKPKSITVPAGSAGGKIGCDVRYESAGGFAYSDIPPSATAGPIAAR